MLARNKPAGLPAVAGGGDPRLRSPLRRLFVKGADDGQAESGLKRAHFKEWRLPFWLLAPQLFILLLFFFIPSIRALIQAFQLTDPFGATTQWVGFQNFERLFRSNVYWSSAQVTLIFTIAQNVLTLSLALLLAFASNHILRGRGAYRTVLLLPYAIAPAIAGIMLAFLFNPASAPSPICCRGWGWTGTRTAIPGMRSRWS